MWRQGIFLDLARAFDAVSIPILVDKLNHVGIQGYAPKIMEDFLCDCTQQVNIGEMTSAKSPDFYGIPQGSILGPSLFSTY